LSWDFFFLCIGSAHHIFILNDVRKYFNDTKSFYTLVTQAETEELFKWAKPRHPETEEVSIHAAGRQNFVFLIMLALTGQSKENFIKRLQKDMDLMNYRQAMENLEQTLQDVSKKRNIRPLLAFAYWKR
jgi:hypothetical protein